MIDYSLNNILEPSADKNIWKDANVVHFSAWEAFPGRGVDMIESMQKSYDDTYKNLSLIHISEPTRPY